MDPGSLSMGQVVCLVVVGVLIFFALIFLDNFKKKGGK